MICSWSNTKYVSEEVFFVVKILKKGGVVTAGLSLSIRTLLFLDNRVLLDLSHLFTPPTLASFNDEVILLITHGHTSRLLLTIFLFH